MEYQTKFFLTEINIKRPLLRNIRINKIHILDSYLETKKYNIHQVESIQKEESNNQDY